MLIYDNDSKLDTLGVGICPGHDKPPSLRTTIPPRGGPGSHSYTMSSWLLGSWLNCRLSLDPEWAISPILCLDTGIPIAQPASFMNQSDGQVRAVTEARYSLKAAGKMPWLIWSKHFRHTNEKEKWNPWELFKSGGIRKSSRGGEFDQGTFYAYTEIP
jgi:hypothetical protein